MSLDQNIPYENVQGQNVRRQNIQSETVQNKMSFPMLKVQIPKEHMSHCQTKSFSDKFLL